MSQMTGTRPGAGGARSRSKATRAGTDHDIAQALEVFVHGFAFVRSLTHPYVPQRVGPAWVMRDAPRKDVRRYRREEWTAHGVEPEALDRLVRAHVQGRFVLCPVRAMDEPDEPLRAAYKELGYRLTFTEPLMIHRLGRVPRARPDGITVRRVTTPAMVDELTKAAAGRQLRHEHLGPDAPVRQYVAMDGSTIVGWVQSVIVRLGGSDGAAAGRTRRSRAEVMTWCSNMFVQPSHRRRGIGGALLARMLRDDRQSGATASVLTASHTGALLYPRVGYVQIGELFAYTPKRT
jgi:GNAT superfamily N-acetyltransferase